MSDNRLTSLRRAVQDATYLDEPTAISALLSADTRSSDQIAAAQALGIELVNACRAKREDRSLLDAFLDQFGLSTEEGVALMCLAESIVRVPDRQTADDLIADKLGSGSWREHLGQSDSMLVNASTWALMLTGEVVELGQPVTQNFGGWFGKLVNRMGEPVIRQSLRQAMKLLGSEFVFASTAEEAMDSTTAGGLYSFDMLGEGARTAADAQRYFAAYVEALTALQKLPDAQQTDASCLTRSGISVKLSALYPRYETQQQTAVHEHLYPRLLALAEQAAKQDVQLTIDAEEANRLDLSLGLIERLVAEPQLQQWQGLGLAVQAYGRRGLALIDWLECLAEQHQRRLIVRLVKGAYWDAEIKLAQQQGVPSYPVFTTKPATDLSYLACAARLLENQKAFFPQFATHNAHTVANVVTIAGNAEYEMQRLHGMGELLYSQATNVLSNPPALRTYAPVGPHKHLMAYLIRRLLENGANSSFVNRFLDDDVPVQRLVRNNRNLVFSTPRTIPEPADLFGSQRPNSKGLELQDPLHLEALQQDLEQYQAVRWEFGDTQHAQARSVHNPADNSDVVGSYVTTNADATDKIVEDANAAFHDWNNTTPQQRATALRRSGELLEQNRTELMALLTREAGKTMEDALDEVREAVDFCYYYAAECERLFTTQVLPGPTGESNQLQLLGRGTFVCISPWNFPLAIFVGQIAAALAAGNTVVAKAASQTTLIAHKAVALLHQAGVPQHAIQLVPGSGRIGASLVANPKIAGVAFTGSTGVAKSIQRSLTEQIAEIVPLIAETGGQNAMLVDSTAMPEQVVDDVVRSAFGSAGQRCSALRILCIQEDIADDVLVMLRGAMDELRIGNPWQDQTDVGPIIDADAQQALLDHIQANQAKVLHQTALPETEVFNAGTYVAPTLIEINSVADLEQEHFGPVLHVRRYPRDDLPKVINELNATGYGLTLGIHSRNNAFVDRITEEVRAGNVYVNRNMIGAVVGVQPFGGRGLSGSGPKAGGPHYVARFAAERTVTNNVAAIGGNLALLTGGVRAET